MNKLLLILVLVCTSACLPPPDGCPPEASRCSDDGIPQVCSGSQRWTNIQPNACAATAVCCATPSVYSTDRIVHACVPASACAEVTP